MFNDNLNFLQSKQVMAKIFIVFLTVGAIFIFFKFSLGSFFEIATNLRGASLKDSDYLVSSIKTLVRSATVEYLKEFKVWR